MTDIVPVKFENEQLLILDQTRLPREEVWIEINTLEDAYAAIRDMQVRGAPAIGVAAAYGLYVAIRDYPEEEEDLWGFRDDLKQKADYLVQARPTAVNLAWAVRRMEDSLTEFGGSIHQAKRILFQEAEAIRKEDEEACLKMGEYGLTLLHPGDGILTHCNAGTLATARYGTCLSPIYLGTEKGYDFRVFADETRPALQGARLTAWELMQSGVDVTLICDNMASSVMQKGWIDAVVVGCDRMAANGDGANKIGTSGVAILANEYGIPFYMFVPTSTIDLDTETGADIKIELRDGKEITDMWYEHPMAPEGVKTYNPSFDVTPARYITAVVTERGIVYPPYHENLRKIME